jgi:hypothetical protein
MASRYSNTSKRWISRILILVAVVLVSGCSMRRILLDNHEWLAGRMAVRYLDLDRKQQDLFAEKLRVFSRRIAESRLGELAGLIESAGKVSDPSVVAEQIEGSVRGILVEACDTFAPVMASLEPDQVELLKEKIEERNDEHDPEKNGGLAQYRRKKREDQVSSTERWTGLLSTRQKQLIEEIDGEKDQAGQWERDYLAYSREAQGVFLASLLRNRANPVKLAEDCRAYASNPDAFLGSQAREMKSRVRAMRRKSLSAIHASLDAQQKLHLARETARLASDLRVWAMAVMKQASP